MNRATGDGGQRQCAGRASSWRSVVKFVQEEVEQKDKVEEEVKFVLSSGSQWCTCKDCLNERAETFTYGCREAVTVAAAVATATTVIDDLRKNGVQ